MDCSGDGDTIIAGYGNGIIELRNRSGSLFWRSGPPEFGLAVSEATISQDGNSSLVTFSGPHYNSVAEAYLFYRTGTILWRNPSFSGKISSNGSIIALAEGKTIRFLSLSGEETAHVRFDLKFNSLVLSEDGSTVVTSTNFEEDPGFLYAVATNGTVLSNISDEAMVRGTAVSSDGRIIAVAELFHIRYFSGASERWNYSSSDNYLTIAMTPDGKYVAAGSDCFIRFFNGSGTQLWRYEPPRGSTGYCQQITTVLISDDGQYIAAGGGRDTFLFSRNGTLLWKDTGLKGQVCMSRDGKYLGIATPPEIRYFDTGAPVPESPSREVSGGNGSSSATSSRAEPVPSPASPSFALQAIAGTGVAVLIIAKVRKNLRES